MSSKYSSKPGLSESPDFGFIIEIYSTSPYNIRNLLFVRSIPLDWSSVVTSSNVAWLSLTW